MESLTQVLTEISRHNRRGIFVKDILDPTFTILGSNTCKNHRFALDYCTDIDRPSVSIVYYFNGKTYVGGHIVMAGDPLRKCEYQEIFGFGSNCSGHDPNKHIFMFKNAKSVNTIVDYVKDSPFDLETAKFIIWCIYNYRLSNNIDKLDLFAELLGQSGYPIMTTEDMAFIFDPFFYL
jgi:hypothetical protein